MEKNGSFGPIFQSSSSSTTQQNSDSSPGLLMNMMDGHIFQDDQKKPLCGLLDIPRSDIDYTTHHDIDEANNKELVTVSGKKKAAGETKKCKKPRYAFQTRSQVDILDDGYRWRKYGQKAVKNNKFPRSYYRCTYQGCNVKKQIQRLSKDEGIVVTTYDGMHSHAIEKSTDNFEHILTQMQIYTSV